MKLVGLVLFWFLASTPAHAQDSGASVESSGSITGSKFHFLKSVCAKEPVEALDSSPQSPPLDVDDPGTPGCGNWEVNILMTADLSITDKSWELPLFDINYGVGDNLQIKYEVPNVRNQTEEGSFSGIGNSKAGIKYMFFEDENDKIEMAFYPQIEFINPHSDGPNPVVDSSSVVTKLPFLLSMKVGESRHGDIRMTANVGYSFASRGSVPSFVSALVGLGYPIFSKLSVMGEIATEQAVTIGDDGVRDQLIKANVGLIGAIYRQILLYGSVGQSLYASDDRKRTYVLAGIRLQ